MRKLRDASAVVVSPIDTNDVLNTLEGIPDGACILAHHDDGIVWGHVAERQIWTGNLVDPDYVITPNLITLQQVRFFWETGEIFIWRDGDNQLQGRQLIEAKDGQAVFACCYDEKQILWGDRTEQVAEGWTRMTDGAQGLAHTVPLTVMNTKQGVRPLRLTIRHYLKEQEDTGALYVAVSRLVNLEAK